MKEKIGTGLTYLLYILLSAAYVLGLFHSFKKHGAGDGFLGTVLFPYAMYRGVESFWHNDFAKVDWNKRLQADMKNCVYFIDQSVNPGADVYQFNKDIEEFSSRIRKYPQLKKNFLMDGCRKYIGFSRGIIEDMKISSVSYFKTGSFEFTKSKPVLDIEDELRRTFKIQDEINNIWTSLNEQFEAVKQIDISVLSTDKISSNMAEYEKKVDTYKTAYLANSGKVFQTLFGQDI